MLKRTLWMVLKGSCRWGRGWIVPCFTPDIRLDLVLFEHFQIEGVAGREGGEGKEPLQLTLKPCCGEMLELSAVFTAHVFIHTHTYFSFQHCELCGPGAATCPEGGCTLTKLCLPASRIQRMLSLYCCFTDVLTCKGKQERNRFWKWMQHALN